MSEVIRIKKGLDINLKGKAKEISAKVETSELFSVRPDDFHGITPKVTVHEGDKVKVGTVLFYSKANPELKFVSPVSGEVIAVNRGDRRKVLDIRLKSDGQFASESFSKVNPSSLSSDEVKEALLNAGYFAFIKQRPYDIIANPNDCPKAIFVSGFDSAPLAPNYEYLMVGREEDFQFGVNALAKLTKGKVHIGINAESASKLYKGTQGVELHEFIGPHPAGNVGVQIHHVDPINKGDIVWVVNAQDVAMIGAAFRTGQITFGRSIVVAGSCVKKPAYYRVTVGECISNLVADNVEGENLRYISGNPLTGTQIPSDGFLGAFDAQISVIPEGDKNNEFLGWIMPRLNKFSVNHSYFSWLFGKNKEYDIDTNINGGERAFIMSGEYDKVFPMDIYPEFLVKAILAKDIDKMEQLGIYEVAPEDFALCEFVCTSKIETQRIVREGLDYLRKELA
ncbi:MAG: Na(+)-translocating NADH-quinone reductase subunit A [Paludibacteraceae bacterium]|nr:Na(+)-translocating NADH-quinone reductase subunit A [Paludibacteraceae bacterium]